MMVYSAAGFLVPDDLENSLTPTQHHVEPVAPHSLARPQPMSNNGLVCRDPAMARGGAARAAHRRV